VEATTDGWMRIRSMSGAISGWIYANEVIRSQDLPRRLPELKFIDGAVGYLEAVKGPNPVAIRAAIQPSLESFAEVGGEDTRLATATAKSMLAVMFVRESSLRAGGY
jgi:hypothetical protein